MERNKRESDSHHLSFPFNLSKIRVCVDVTKQDRYISQMQLVFAVCIVMWLYLDKV